MSTCREAAQRYLAAGLSAIPIRSDGSKAPTIKWDLYQRQRATEALAEKWYRNSGAGVALIGGVVSGNLEILDFDRPDLYECYEALADDNGLGELVRRLPLVETPSGGAHCYYRCEQPVGGNRKLARDASQQTLIETRGEGGYAIVPPSPAACHPDRRPYVMRRGDLTALPVLSEGEVTALHRLARACSDTEVVQGTTSTPGTRKPTRTRRLDQPLLPGTDYNERGDVLDLLRRHGWTIKRSGGGYKCCRPGITDHHGATYDMPQAPGLLYVFSSNVAPFEADRAYTPFAAYALLDHGGDYSAAARALYALDYGDRRERRQPTAPKPGADQIEPQTAHTGILAAFAGALADLPVQVEQMGLTIPTGTSTADYTSIGWALIRVCGDAKAWGNFALGDWYNQLPTAYGDKGHAVEQTFGKQHYQCMRQYGSVAGKWPISSRQPGVGWSFWYETADRCFADSDRKRFLDQYTDRPRRITIDQIRSAKKARKSGSDPTSTVPRDDTPEGDDIMDRMPKRLIALLREMDEQRPELIERLTEIGETMLAEGQDTVMRYIDDNSIHNQPNVDQAHLVAA
jgi:hypothetical protein